MQGTERVRRDRMYDRVIADLPLNQGSSYMDLKKWMQILEKSTNKNYHVILLFHSKSTRPVIIVL